jgi:hypothetical protein
MAYKQQMLISYSSADWKVNQATGSKNEYYQSSQKQKQMLMQIQRTCDSYNCAGGDVN